MVRVTGNSLAKPGMEGQGRQTIITGVSAFHAIKHKTETDGCFKWWPIFKTNSTVTGFGATVKTWPGCPVP